MLDLLEALLFQETEPLSVTRLAKKAGQSVDAVREALATLAARRNTTDFGIHLLHSADDWQLVTAPHLSGLLDSGAGKSDVAEELTRSSLETLAIIAYRGPITRAAIDAIRGVNSTLMLRSLLMRGLIIEAETSPGVVNYSVSTEALAFLGLHSIEELPDFASFRTNTDLDKLLGFVSEKS